MDDASVFKEIVSRCDMPLLVVLSGPSGVGKDAVLSKMRELDYPFHYTVTMTTRPKRPAERDGVDYFFTTQQSFESIIERDGFLEWANVYGNFYGVPRSQVRDALKQGKDVIVKADVQGAKTIRASVPEAVTIFLAPPCFDDLADRLRQRKTESARDLAIRMATAQEEMKCLALFDYVVVNASDQLVEAASRIQSIIEAEKCRVERKKVEV